MRRPIDVLSAGELLVDFVTAEFVQSPDEASLFKRQPGGGAATLALNMARLGNNTLLASCVGNDETGNTLIGYVQKTGVDVTHISRVDEPTSLVLYTRSARESSVQYYRGADSQLSIRQFPFQYFEQISIFHTTCFALSRDPAQQVLLQAAEKAKRAGCQLSLDANYSAKVWPDKSEALRSISEFCRLQSLIRISEDDWRQLYEGEMPEPESVIEHFLKKGASEVCLTLGDKGCWVGNTEEKLFLSSRPTEIRDNTGIGDAFWAGYLTARLDGRTMLECSIAGRKMAELKQAHPGHFPATVDRAQVYEDLG